MSNPRVFKSEVEALREQARLIVVEEVWTPVVRVEGGWSLKYDPQA
jgi:hypothetical protein